uniref:RecF/RecN/SMC N-terminal domain-containing protein n=1 Tax=Spongospora subterranea TaxID=70186 RepID=A0A0H5QI07_9EUKA|eukprot:CRZ00951.1 hypothetical protein [Spongospora subterranea]
MYNRTFSFAFSYNVSLKTCICLSLLYSDQINQITTAKEGTAKELKSLTEKSFSLKTIAFADQAALKAFNDELADFKSKSGEVQSRINALDAECSKIHQRRRDMLQVCRLEQITIPIVNKKKTSKRRRSSTVSDSEDNGALASDQEDLEIDRSTSASQSQLDVQDIAKVEPNTIDYRKLRHEREILNAEHYNALQQDFEDEVARIHSEMESLAPNLKSFDKFDEMKDRIASAGADFEAAKVLSKEAADSFNVSRQQRLDKFMDAFNHVSNSIDEIYKQLTRSARFPLGGTAHLSLENPDDPFNNGIKFHAMPPMKRFRDMEQLSGGEKTVAALALLFAIHNYRPSPFFVLDEVDAALDKANVTKVARYVRYRAHEDNLQCIVISLKDTFFDKSDALIGVFKDRTNNSSGCITLDLNKYGD